MLLLVRLSSHGRNALWRPCVLGISSRSYCHEVIQMHKFGHLALTRQRLVVPAWRFSPCLRSTCKIDLYTR